MQKTILLITLMAFNFQVNAAAPKNTKEMTTCERLNKQAEENCTEFMCEDAIASNVECIKDGDFYEGLQVCVDDELRDLIATYNKKHSGKNLTCRE